MEYYSELKLAVAFHDANLQIWRGSEEHNYERYIFPNLGILYWKMGDFEQALEYHQRALEIQEKQLGPNNVDVAASYNNIGTVCSDKGDLDQATDYYRRTLEI